MIGALLSLGIFVAVPLTGRVVLGRLGSSIPAIARPSLWVACGVAIWSVPLLGSLILGAYHPEIIGAAGWVTVAGLVALKKVGRPGVPRLGHWDCIVLIGLVCAAALAAAFPADPLTAALDMGTYSSHAVYMADHGRLDVPYPGPDDQPIPNALFATGAVFASHPSMTVRFSNLFPAWLAQTYAAAGYGALIRLNVLVGLLALLAIYGLAKRFVRPSFAGFGILFLAFNPAQIWVARQTLSEILTQLLVWCGLLLLTAYLARGRPSWGVWTGILLGLSAFAHIDAFVLVPLLLISHALSRVVAPGRRPTWGYVYLGATPLFGLALAYYAILNQPYLRRVDTQMLEIGALTLAAAALLALTRSKRLAAGARVALADRRLVLGLLAVLAGVAVYVYFIRPILPPFARFVGAGNLLNGQRSYVEDALANAGRYLTPGVVWAALLGWSIVFVAISRRSRAAAAWAPLVIVAMGITAVYTWNQSVFPDHFWAIRRFVPEIIPAMVLFAGVGTAWLLGHLSKPGRRLAIGLIVPLLVVWTIYIGAPMYVTPERQGSYAELGQFAESVPSDSLAVAVDGVYEAAHYWMPLLLAFDRPIIPLDPTDDTARAEAITQLNAASEDDPVTIVTAAYDFRMDAVVGTRTAQVSWSSPVMAETTNPVPRVVLEQDNTLTVIRATGLNTIGVAFGGAPQWVAAGTGFHPAQLVDGRPLRWTDGAGQIAIPIEGDQTPTRLAISIADTGPNGGPLHVTLNDITLFDGVLPPGPWSATYDLAGLVDLHQGDTANVEITSDTFQANPVINGDRETTFGVQVDTVMLLEAE